MNLAPYHHTMEVVSVRVTVFQNDSEPSAESFSGQFFSFGLVPRETNLLVSNGSGVGFLPHLELFQTTASGGRASQVWGQGGVPFPPGLQLDLTSAEVSSKRPVVLVGPHVLPEGDDELSVVSFRVEFTMHCSGTGFGASF